MKACGEGGSFTGILKTPLYLIFLKSENAVQLKNQLKYSLRIV
ncbi:hypothetical protein SDC9_76816 [bioreactor metagenome]|uniref:Uncharacterized protein n=1 Tax=bioreactor metagenome TaxID=1076179 RepID=A0A644YQJ0_9ZZZZ